VISGAHRLISKESNRALVLHREFSNLNVPIELLDDKMVVQGGQVESGTIDSNNDHRIAMAAAVAGINAKGAITIKGAECVTKSYPYFFDDYTKLGGVAYE
jgi:3-phosphoshikimate 1-carboxyvinyltransferase